MTALAERERLRSLVEPFLMETKAWAAAAS